MFKITDVFMILLLIINFVITLKVIGDIVNKCCTLKEHELRKNKKKIKTLVMITIINMSIMILLVLAYFLIRFNSSVNFIFNVNTVAKEYYKEIDKDELLKTAFSSVLDELNDPYSKILESKDIDFFDGKKLDFGYGILLENDEAYINHLNEHIVEQNTIKNNDKIISVNGINVEGKTEDEIVQLFNDINSNYTIQIERDNKLLEFNLSLQSLDFENVTSTIYEEDNQKIGYIKLESFTLDSYNEFKSAFDELNNSNITSLIIDLRDNLGGEQSNMINIASLFLSNDKVIFKAQKRNKEEIVYSKGKEDVSYSIVFLSNNNTASSSEILILALKEGCNAKLIGTQTYGKGIGQSVYIAKDYMYQITSEYWTSPSGVSVNNVGITPDIIVENFNENDLQLQKAKEYIKSLK